MNASQSMPFEEVIAALRTVEAPHRVVPSVAHLRQLIDDLVSGVRLEETVARPEFAAFSQSDVLSFVEEFGKHRARVFKRNLDKATPMAWYESGMLLPPSAQEMDQARAKLESGRRLPKALQRMDPQLLLEKHLFMPQGYEKSAGHGRDIGKSLAALTASPVDDAEIIRFAERHFAEPTTVLDADHVRLLHWVASRGLGAKLLELGGLRVDVVKGVRTVVRAGGSNIPLVRLLVEAYDLLEVARADAVDGVAGLLSAAAAARPSEKVPNPVVDVAAVRAAAAKARLLAPADIGRLDKLAGEVEKDPENTRLREILRTRLANLALQVQANPSTFKVRGVEALNSGHLTQILASSGLVTDEAEDKAVIAELRTRLTEMGLTNDLDREIPEGLRAFKLGRLEEFYSSRQARVEGDPDWKLLYEASAALEELQTV